MPKSSCNWEGAKPQTAKPSPPHNTGNTEGDALPNAQNRSEENKITAHSWTLLPNCLTCGRKACRWIRGRRLWAQRIFLLSVSNPDINLQSSLPVHAWAFLQCWFSQPINGQITAGSSPYHHRFIVLFVLFIPTILHSHIQYVPKMMRMKTFSN